MEPTEQKKSAEQSTASTDNNVPVSDNIPSDPSMIRPTQTEPPSVEPTPAPEPTPIIEPTPIAEAPPVIEPTPIAEPLPVNKPAEAQTTEPPADVAPDEAETTEEAPTNDSMESRAKSFINEIKQIKFNKETLKDLKPKELVNDIIKVTKNKFKAYSDNYEAVIGVDITPHHIHICEMRNNDDQWELSSLASAEIEGKSQISDIYSTPETYSEVLKQLVHDAKLHTNRAAIALPTSAAVVRIITIPMMEETQLNQAINFGNFWENLVQIPNLEDYSVFHQVIKKDSVRNSMDILFVAAKLTDIEVYNNIVKQAGLQPIIIDVSCFSLLNATHINEREDEKNQKSEAPIAYLQFGADENYLVVQDGFEPFLYDIYVSDKERDHIMENLTNHDALENFLKRYSTQAKQLIANHETSYQTKPISKIFVVSALPMVDSVVGSLRSSLSDYDVQACNFFEHIDIPPNLIEKVNADENHSSWAVSLGLAVHHLDVFGYYDKDQSEDKINLLPGRERFIRLERYVIELTLALSTITVLAFLGILFTYASTFFTESELDQKLASLSHVEQKYKDETERSARLNVRYKKLAELDKMMDKIPANQKSSLWAFNFITNNIPEGVWLLSSTFQNPSSMSLKGKSINDKRILKFIDALKANKNITNVKLKKMQVIKEKDKITGKNVSLKSFDMLISFNPKTIHITEQPSKEAK